LELCHHDQVDQSKTQEQYLTHLDHHLIDHIGFSGSVNSITVRQFIRIDQWLQFSRQKGGIASLCHSGCHRHVAALVLTVDALHTLLQL